jgi:predicted nucleotide-binding protein
MTDTTNATEQPEPPEHLDSDAHAWALAHRPFLRCVFEEFQRTGTWPRRDLLQRQLVATDGGNALDLWREIQGMRGELGRLEGGSEARIILTLFALRYLPEAEELLKQFTEIVTLVAERYRNPDAELMLSRSDVDQIAATDEEADKLTQLLFADSRFIGSGSVEGDWSREITDYQMPRLLGIRKIDDYLSLQASTIHARPAPPPLADVAPTMDEPSRKVFVVHGRDEGLRAQVARVLEQLDFEPLILTEEPNEGQTILEKFEAKALDAGFAVVLLSPDDRAAGPEEDETPPLPNRARQNVILELGYFMGKLGRKRVAPLYREGTELPSDIHGLVYIPLDDAGAWRYRLASELAAIGYDVAFDRIQS